MNKFKFKINEDGFYCGYGTDGTIAMNEEFNLSNLPTDCHKHDGTTWVLDKDKYIETLTEEVRTLRSAKYPPLGDMAGALYDYFLQKRLNGEKLPDELNQWVSDCTSVKTEYPKPETEEV